MLDPTMSRVLALIGNRPNVCAAAAQKYTPQLAVHRSVVQREAAREDNADGVLTGSSQQGSAQASRMASEVPSEALSQPVTALGWGLGFYQAGEPLLRRRPVDERELVQISAFHDISSSAYLAQIRRPTVGALRTENTPPFRFRRWLFAMRGTVPGFGALRVNLLSSLPAALRSNIRGQSDGEYVFHSFLSSLDSSSGLSRDSIAPGDIGAALVRSVLQLDSHLESEGLRRATIDCFATNGEHLVALHRSGTMSHCWMEGAEQLESWLPPSLERTGTELFRCSLLMAGGDRPVDGWESLGTDSLILCSRTEPPVIQSL